MPSKVAPGRLEILFGGFLLALQERCTRRSRLKIAQTRALRDGSRDFLLYHLSVTRAGDKTFGFTGKFDFMIYTSAPHPAPEDLTAIDHAIERISPPAEMQDWFKGYAAGHRTRLAQDLTMIGHYAPGARSIVEIGALPLILTSALAQKGGDLTGLDIAPERFDGAIAALGVDILKCDIETEPFPVPDASADLVLLNEVFEHLRINLLFTMSEIRRILKPDGILMMSTPNMRSIKGLRALLGQGRGAWCCPDLHSEWSKLDDLGHMGHVREYTPRDVTDFLERLGIACRTIAFREGGGTPLGRMIYKVRPQFRPVMSFIGSPAG